MLRRSLLVLAAALAGIAPACGGDGPAPERTADVPCAGVVPEDILAQRGLPNEVEMTRHEILDAASRCDYDILEELALHGPSFNYSFGEPSELPGADPAGYWEAQVEAGNDVLDVLIRLLGMHHASYETDQGALYVWPSAAGEAPADKDWQAVEEEFGEQSRDWRAPEGYVGPRVGITAEGVWMFYVSGD